MTIWRRYYCDGPANPDSPHPDNKDQCPHGAGAAFGEPMPIGWVRLAGWEPRHLYFCCWDCVLRYGARIEPVITIRLDDE